MKITTKDDVIQKVQENHVWLNAFQCIKPTPEFCERLGRSIINMLTQKENLLPSYSEFDGSESQQTIDAVLRISEITPMLYLSINKS